MRLMSTGLVRIWKCLLDLTFFSIQLGRVTQDGTKSINLLSWRCIRLEKRNILICTVLQYTSQWFLYPCGGYKYYVYQENTHVRGVLTVEACVYVCMVITCSIIYQLDKVANPARGQLDKENEYFRIPVRA